MPSLIPLVLSKGGTFGLSATSSTSSPSRQIALSPLVEALLASPVRKACEASSRAPGASRAIGDRRTATRHERTVERRTGAVDNAEARRAVEAGVKEKKDGESVRASKNRRARFNTAGESSQELEASIDCIATKQMSACRNGESTMLSKLTSQLVSDAGDLKRIERLATAAQAFLSRIVHLHSLCLPFSARRAVDGRFGCSFPAFFRVCEDGCIFEYTAKNLGEML